MVKDIEIKTLEKDDLRAAYLLIQNTVDISYRDIYPTEAINLFKNHHTQGRILDEATSGYTVVAILKGEIIGTGTLFGTNIRRVYVSPQYQRRNVGKLIVEELERKARSDRISIIDLEASLGSKEFWEQIGFVVQREDFVPVENNQKLHYYKMAKTLSDK